MSHRLDINPRAPAASFGERVAAPGDSRRLATSQISGYAPGATVRFFVYRVSGGEGVYRGGLDVTYAELAAPAWRVVISESTLTGPNLDFGHLSGASS